MYIISWIISRQVLDDFVQSSRYNPQNNKVALKWLENINYADAVQSRCLAYRTYSSAIKAIRLRFVIHVVILTHSSIALLSWSYYRPSRPADF